MDQVSSERLEWAIKNADRRLKRATMDYDSFDEVVNTPTHYWVWLPGGTAE